MTDLGYSYADDSALGPDGSGQLDQEQGIKTALDDVECKLSTGLIQKLSDVAAAYQKVFISENEAALVAEKSGLDELLAKAKQIIATTS